MTWWSPLRYRSRRHAALAASSARLHGFGMELGAGRRRYRMDIIAPAPREHAPLRLHLRCALGDGHVDLDLAALDPALDPSLCEHVEASELPALLAASGPWLCLLEGLLGTPLQVTSASSRRRRGRATLRLQLQDVASGRIGHLGLAGAALLQALRRRIDVQQWQAAQQRQAMARLQVAAVVCLQACRLRRAQLARATPGAVIRIAAEQPLLRFALAHGAIDLPLAIEDRTCMIQTPLPSLPPDPDAALVPVEQLALGVDVVLASLRLGVEDIARLQPGATLELPVPLKRSAVILRCEGTPFARGELVRVGERLGVLIEQLGAAPGP